MAVRIAQIGIDHPHAAGFRETMMLMPEVELVAFYDPDPAQARGLLQPELCHLPTYRSLPVLLRETRPEAVMITLPNAATPGAVVQAAEAGVHVYAEKPCARTAAEFLPALEAVREAGVQFATGYLRRASPVGQAIRQIVEQGLLGRLVSVEARWITTSVQRRNPAHFLFDEARSGGGILHWLGCHWLDFMSWCTGAEVTEVSAILDTLSGAKIGVEDMAALALRYDTGMIGTLHCGYVTDKATTQLFFGLRGTLGWLEWQRMDDGFAAHSTHPDWMAAPTRVFQFDSEPVGGYLGATGLVALRRFIASFREGATPWFRADDALRVLRVLDAAHESSLTGRRVAIATEPR